MPHSPYHDKTLLYHIPTPKTKPHLPTIKVKISRDVILGLLRTTTGMYSNILTKKLFWDIEYKEYSFCSTFVGTQKKGITTPISLQKTGPHGYFVYLNISRTYMIYTIFSGPRRVLQSYKNPASLRGTGLRGRSIRGPTTYYSSEFEYPQA